MSLLLSKRSQLIGDSPTLQINAQARALKAAGEPVIHLGGGEPTYPARCGGDCQKSAKPQN